MCLKIILKVTKNLSLSLEDTFFENPQGDGVKLTAPPLPPHPSRFRVKNCLRFLHYAGANLFCKTCEYNNNPSLIQIKVSYKNLQENFRHPLIRISYRKEVNSL